jgi:dipeptidyl aminopeptidase/acylaminoacyl peptidase
MAMTRSIMRATAACFLALVLGCGGERPRPRPPAAPAMPATARALPSGAPTTTASAGPAGPAVHAPQAPVALEEYFKARRLGTATFSHDEKLVAYMSDEGGRPDLWVQPVGGGKAVQLTHVRGFLMSYSFSPTADQLVYESDEGGTELPHLYLTDSKGTAPKDLTADYPKGARTGFVRWADDGKTFLYLSNKRDPKYLDLLEYTVATGKSETLWQSSGRLSFTDVSRDHKRFIIGETISDVDSNLYLLERGKQEPVLLTPHQGEVLYESHTFSRDGKSLYYTSDEGREFNRLAKMDLASKKSTDVLQADWDVDSSGFSRAFKYFYTVTNVDGTPRVELSDAKTGKKIELPKLPGEGAFVPLRFSNSDRYLAASLITDTAPPTLYVIDLKSGTPTKLSEVLPDSLRSRTMVSGASVRIPSFDGRPVPAYLYQPQGNGPFPAVIDVHGGPTSQSKRRFDPLRQYLVSKGYVVLVPNVRGSTGYGKSYTKLDNLDLGGGPLKDVVACKRFLTASAKVDANRVVVLGGSYGGYMALAAAAFTPSEFAANVDYFGVSDLKSLVESFPPYWTSMATYIYRKFGDPKNPADAGYQHDRSPLFFAGQIVRPLLVVQGENDARVKKDQSDRIVQELRSRKVPVHYVILAGEGHGFSKNENRLQAYQATDRFLDRYVLGDTAVTVPGQ